MLNWGIIGLGSMAHQFANAINELENVKLLSVASRSKSKLENFQKNFKIDRKNLFQNYEDIINCPNLDAVYISTLNFTHLKILNLLSNSKIKILCEKPFVMNFAEAQEISAKIKKEQNNFYEAIAYRSHPQTNKILELVNNDEIGKIKKIKSTFGFKVRKIREKSRLFNKETGGGVLLDLGCYPISFVRLFLNKNSKLLIDNAKGSFCKTDVEDHAELRGTINDNIEIDLKISFKENMENSCIIYGSKGILKVPSPWLPQKKTYIEIDKENSYYKNFVNCDFSVYANQIKTISDKFFIKDEIMDNLININESVEISKILTEWKNKI